MEVECELFIDDLMAFHLYHNQHSPAYRRTLLVFQCVFGILAGLSVMAGLVTRSYWQALAWLAVGILLVAFAPRVLQGSVRRQVLRLYGRGESTRLIGKHRFSLTPEVMVDATERGDSRTPWGDVGRVVSTDNYLFIYTDAVLAAIVPKRSFSDDTECTEFIETAAQYQAENA